MWSLIAETVQKNAHFSLSQKLLETWHVQKHFLNFTIFKNLSSLHDAHIKGLRTAWLDM